MRFNSTPPSGLFGFHLTEQLNQQGDVDAAEHWLDASVGAPMAHVESFRKGIVIES